MAMTPEQSQQDQSDYGAAYDEDMQTPVQQTEDEAFGLVPDESVMEDDGIPNTPEEATEVIDETPDAESVTSAAPVQATTLTPEEQRLKSWEGRLKAREAELNAMSAGKTTQDEDGESMDHDSSESEIQETIEDAVEATEGMDPDEALKALSADFGEDFTKMISSIIDAKVAKASSGVSQSVDEIINDIVDSKAKAHFETIADRHPDFMDVANSDEFKAYCESQPGCAQVVESGSAREINKMLDKYKKTLGQPAEESDDSMDAAEGVRSTGMRLPPQPSSSSDYAAAWDEA